MPTNQIDHSAPQNPAGADNNARVGNTRQLLRTLHGDKMQGHDRLYDEICRVNPGKQHDPSELIECSVKMSLRGFFQRRHGGTVSWERSERGKLAEAAYSAAPNDVMRSVFWEPQASTTETLSKPAPSTATPQPSTAGDDAQKLRAWAARTTRFFTAIAYDFDAQLYKLYQFHHHPVHYLEDLDLCARLSELDSLAYIRSMEVAMDDPKQSYEALYFKLRFLSAPNLDPAAAKTSIVSRRKLHEVLAADYRPHPLLSPRILSAISQRAKVVGHLERILADLCITNDPVIKLVPPPASLANAGTDRLTRAWAELDYGINLNLLDRARIRFVGDYEATILGIAEALGCQGEAKAWLSQIAPFDCFLSYLGLGSDSVTLYYRSTTLQRRQQAPHFVRKNRGPQSGGDAPSDAKPPHP